MRICARGLKTLNRGGDRCRVQAGSRHKDEQDPEAPAPQVEREGEDEPNCTGGAAGFLAAIS